MGFENLQTLFECHLRVTDYIFLANQAPHAQKSSTAWNNFLPRFRNLRICIGFWLELAGKNADVQGSGKKRCKKCPTFCCYLINHKYLIVVVNTTSGIITLKIFEWSKITKNFSKVNKCLIDLHTRRLLAQSDYTRSCIHRIVLLRTNTELLETCRGYK